VFEEFSKQIEELVKTYKLVPVAWPVSYDWQWINHYFHRFTGNNPFGYSAIDIKSYLWALSKNRSPNDQINVEKWVDPQFKHTHKALDDAKEQGAMFVNAWKENINSKV